MLSPRKLLALFALLSLTACGFRPLYGGAGTDDSVSGQTLTRETAAIFIDEISDRTGQVLRRALSDRLAPRGETTDPRYRLSVRLSDAVLTQQGVRKDNLATRYVMTYTARFTLYSYPENEKLLNDSAVGRTSYDVQRSPYATDVAERSAKERVMKILGDDISLRLAAFLKSHNVKNGGE